jgi:two-component system, cell cycle sensor histidine kinase and response regulator CckA
MTSDVPEQRYKALFDSTEVGVVIIDGDRRIVDCNSAFSHITGRSRGELVGEIATTLTAERAGAAESRLDELSAGDLDSYAIERYFVRPDGSSVRVRIATSRMSATEELYGSIVEDITDRDEADRRLVEQSALLNRAQRIAGVGAWAWYPNESRNEWSPQARRIYGLTDADADTGDPALFFDLVHPDDRADVLDGCLDRFHAGLPSSIEHRIRRADGVRWVREQAEVILDDAGAPHHVVGVVLDITDQKRADGDVREKAAALAQAHEVARLGSFNVDVATRRTHLSLEAAKLLGCDGPLVLRLEEFRDRFVPADDREQWAEDFDAAYRRGGTYSFEYRMRRDDGAVIWAHVHGRVDVDEFGRPERAVGVVQDVTEQHRLDEQLRETQKMQAVGLLASGVAHDFNNLLLVIGANAQLALQHAPSGLRQELEEIAQATDRGAALVRQLLGFSRRKGTVEHRPVVVNEVVRDVRRMLERVVSRAIDVEIELTDAPTTVIGDVARLEQALLNLAVNARDAMQDGGRVTIATERTDDDEVVLRLSDTGAGMDETTRERIFEPFFTTKSDRGGTGLGLPMVYATVKEFNGMIEVDSEVGRGTTFTIAIPSAPDGEPRRKPKGDTRPVGRRILLVEDDPLVRTVSAEMLARAGYAVDGVDGGEQALRRFDDGVGYDLVVTDFMMPRMTGLQLVSELRRREIDLPVIYTSGYADRGMLPEDGRGARFVAKPFSGTEVTAAIDELLRDSC